MADEYDLSPYDMERTELFDWLSDGEKSQDDFDREFSDYNLFSKPSSSSYTKISPHAPILGSLSQGLGPQCWAGRLDLLQWMCRRGEITAVERNGKIWYSLPVKEPVNA